MTRRRRAILTVLALLLLLGAAGAAGVWFFFFSSPPPGVATIDSADDAVVDPSGSAGGAVDGTWTVDTSIGSFSDYSGSWAGFRVDEVLQNIGDTTAIGRTPGVSGQLTLDGQTLAAATIEVELTTITSNQSRRDPAIQDTLETGQYPTATFELSEPVDLPQAPAEGVTYEVDATGVLTIHGQSRPVAADLQARLVNGVIVVVGSAPFTFSDYGMSAPRAPIVLSVEDHGVIEFQLFFTR